jgi:hypothetical protein
MAIIVTKKGLGNPRFHNLLFRALNGIVRYRGLPPRDYFGII